MGDRQRTTIWSRCRIHLVAEIVDGELWTSPRLAPRYAHAHTVIGGVLVTTYGYATKIKAPTLILALTGDYRVPIMQSYRLYHALRDNGVPVQFIGYPLPGHSPSDPVHQRDVDKRWIEWLKTHLER